MQSTVKRSSRLTRFLRGAKKDYSNWLFMMPFIVGFLLFVFYPIITSLYYSFTNFNALRITKIGLFNYADIFDFSKFGMGKDIWKSFGLTGLYAVISIPLNILLSYTLALVLRKNIPGIKIIRLLCYLPVLIPGIVFGQIWMDMLGYPEGLINQWLVNSGLSKHTFFSSESTQFLTLIIVSQWGIGGGMIIWLAALENVPKTMYEAADIDGANYFTKLFKITLPMCSSIIFYNLICSLIACLQTFDSYAYLGRGENDATYFISIRIYVTAFAGDVHNYGLACALAWVLFCFIAVLTAIMFKTSKWVFYGDE